MLLLLRKTIFYILAAAYLIFTPTIIFNALGYGIDARQRELYKTGLISVTTFPKGANVYVEGKRFSGKTPTLITDLLPGDYRVRIWRKGFEAWEKKITIASEKATRLEPVLLLPNKPEVENLSLRRYTNLLPVEFSDFKLYTFDANTPGGLWRIDLLFRKETPAGKRTPFVNAPILKVESQKGSSLLALKIGDPAQSRWLMLDPEHEKRTIDLSTLLPRAPQRVEWDPRNTSRIYAYDNGALSEIDLKNTTVRANFAQGIKGFGIKFGRLYLLKNDNTLWTANAHGENPEPLVDETAPGQNVFSALPSAYYRIEVVKRDLFQRDLLLFHGDQGTLVSNWLPHVLIREGARGTQYSTHSDAEKILYFTRTKIGAIDFSSGPTETAVEQGPVKTVLFAKGSNIRQAFWAFEDTHIVFLDGDTVFLLEAQNEAPYYVHELARVAPGSQILYQERHHAFYYIEPQSGHLMRRKLMD